MNLGHRSTRSRSIFIPFAAAIAITFCGCTDMLPSDSTWEKWSPSNIWYRMQPNQLGRLNEGSGLSPDVYYSISDYTEHSANRASSAASVIQPIDETAANP